MGTSSPLCSHGPEYGVVKSHMSNCPLNTPSVLVAVDTRKARLCSTQSSPSCLGDGDGKLALESSVREELTEGHTTNVGGEDKPAWKRRTGLQRGRDP